MQEFAMVCERYASACNVLMRLNNTTANCPKLRLYAIRHYLKSTMAKYNMQPSWLYWDDDDLPTHINGPNMYWMKSGVLHRDIGPAHINIAFAQLWYKRGMRHRPYDLPAVMYNNGHSEWWVRDKRHRTDGPAIYDSNGNESWYKHGLLHRIDLPAITQDGTTMYFKNGKLHRSNDMPAVQSSGETCWYQHGKLHRSNDMPAVVRKSGHKYWYTHGVQTRAYGAPYATYDRWGAL
jgi:hypothetical protein